MGFFDKLFGKSTKTEEEPMTKLNIGIILGSTREGLSEYAKPFPMCD